MNELKVQQIINQRNISVRQFAEMLGITREHCYHVLRGENVSKKQLENMSRVLNLPIRDLYRTHEEIASEYDPYTIEFGRTEHYKASDIVTFSKLSGKYGALSNMSTAFPINLFGHHCYTSEHLFIALRFSGHPDIQQKVLEYKNSMWCKKTFINSKEYEPYQHPHWRDNYFDIEVMKYIINLKYQQNEGFRVLLNETKGKIIVEDTTMQKSSNSALRWGCQDLQKRDLIKLTRKDLKAFISETLNKEKKKQATLKKPRAETAQKRQEQKQKKWEAIVEKVQDVYEQALLEHCHYTLSGENALGKILTVIRDQGNINYQLNYPLYFFEHEIK